MNSASEFMHEGMDRLVWHKDCMSPFCLSLRVRVNGVVITGVVFPCGCISLGFCDTETACTWSSML